jgi:hypothetical protein
MSTKKKDFTVENLISSWETVSNAVSPELIAAEAEEVNPALAQLSLLSSRKEYWECFVCAVGFARERSAVVGDVLVQVASDLETKPVQVQGQTRDFLDYCTTYSSVPEKTLSAATTIIVSGFGVMDPKLLMDFETCYELCGDDNNCLATCLGKAKPRV